MRLELIAAMLMLLFTLLFSQSFSWEIMGGNVEIILFFMKYSHQSIPCAAFLFFFLSLVTVSTVTTDPAMVSANGKC
jgi:hypothetical protein